jgi:hypothetical protein
MVMPESRSSHSFRAANRSRRPAASGRNRQDWIADQLKRVYDEALGEEIPDNMLDLLRQLNGAAPPGEASDDAGAAPEDEDGDENGDEDRR